MTSPLVPRVYTVFLRIGSQRCLSATIPFQKYHSAQVTTLEQFYRSSYQITIEFPDHSILHLGQRLTSGLDSNTVFEGGRKEEVNLQLTTHSNVLVGVDNLVPEMLCRIENDDHEKWPKFWPKYETCNYSIGSRLALATSLALVALPKGSVSHHTLGLAFNRMFC